MFSVGLIGGNDTNHPQSVNCIITQLVKLFPIARYQGDFEEIQRKYSCLPPGADPNKYLKLRVLPTMDQITKK